jgi:hypothetical protein
MNTGRILAISLAAAAAGALPAAPAAAQTIHACVQQQTGDVRIVAAGSACPRNYDPLQWSQSGPQGPAGPTGPTGPAGPTPLPPQLHVQYIMTVGMGYARAFCPPEWKVTGGGGFSVDNTPLAQSLPISTLDGVIAHDQAAIGWQVVSAVWTADPPQVQTFVACARVF